MKIYHRIEKEFNYPYENEVKARDKLSEILGNDFLKIEEIGREIGDEVYVVGFSPKLEDEIEIIPEDARVIAADESANILVDYGIIPQMVISDLDGNIESLFSRNIIFGIHAHGDNIEKLDEVRKIKKRFGTTQIEPIWNVYNFGGFTDGDRCVFLAAYFNATIHIVGFDFDRVRDKRGKKSDVKIKKLKWAKKLIGELEKDGAKIIWENLKL